MTYQEAKEIKKALEREVDALSSEYERKYKPCKLSNGLIPYEISITEEFQELNNKYGTAFKNLQNFNKYFVKTFKKEYAADRLQQRQKAQ